MSVEKDHLSPEEFAKVTSQGLRSVYRRLEDGSIPGAYRQGKLWRIHLPTFEASIRKDAGVGKDD